MTESVCLPALCIPPARADAGSGKDLFICIGCNARMPTAPDAATPLATLHACLEQFGHTLGIARRLVQSGRPVDLTGLDAEMGFICARALDLPPEEGRAVRPTLLALRGEIDALTAALAAQPPPSG